MENEIKLLKQYLGVHPDTELKETLEARIQELEAKLISNSAEYVKTVTVRDPDSNGYVDIEVFKHEGGGMFAVDSSYLEQCFDDDTDPVIPDPFNDGQTVTLYNL